MKPGDKIAQLVFADVLAAELEETEELSETPRGENGFGSTGSSFTNMEYLLKLEAHMKEIRTLPPGEYFNVEELISHLEKVLKDLKKGKNPDAKKLYSFGRPELVVCFNADEYLTTEMIEERETTSENVCLHSAFLYGIEQGRRMTETKFEELSFLNNALKTMEGK